MRFFDDEAAVAPEAEEAVEAEAEEEAEEAV